MTTKKLTKLLALYLPYILLGLLATNIGETWRLAEGKELGERIMSMMGTFSLAFANPLPSFHPLDLLIGFSCGAGLRLAVYLRSKNAKKYRHGMEYGSARWGNAKDIEPFQVPKFADNIILTKTERLMMSNRPPDPKNARNKNVLVVGGSGSGKTRFWLKPNLLQCHSSYVVTDPKGTIVLECGQAMLKNGYRVKILNTINFAKSMHYNPFSYVHSEKDILKLVTTLMTNTKGEGSGGDPFWEKSERLLLTALIAYLHYEAPVEEQNFATLLEMLNSMQVLEDDEEFQNPVDLLFEDLAKKKPNSFAGRQYKLYKLAAGKTAKSILISCGARLAPFDIQELRDLTMYDELELDTLGDKKTALFLIMSDTDSTFNFLISMVYTQLFNLLCDKADDVYGGKLPIHVRCLIDEAANIGQIPNLEKLVATIRSREISACLVLQAKSQLKAIMNRLLCETRTIHCGKVQVTLRLQNSNRLVHVWASGKNFTVRISKEGNVHIELASYNPHRKYSEQIYSYAPTENSQEKFFIAFAQQITFLIMLFLDDWWGHFSDYLWYLEKHPNLKQAAQIMQYEYYLKNNGSDKHIDLLDDLEV